MVYISRPFSTFQNLEPSHVRPQHSKDKIKGNSAKFYLLHCGDISDQDGEATLTGRSSTPRRTRSGRSGRWPVERWWRPTTGPPGVSSGRLGSAPGTLFPSPVRPCPPQTRPTSSSPGWAWWLLTTSLTDDLFCLWPWIGFRPTLCELSLKL